MNYKVENGKEIIEFANGREKFAIVHTKGNTEKILGTFDTIEEARAAGKELAAMCEGGLVTLISAEFDENGKRTNGRERIYDEF